VPEKPRISHLEPKVAEAIKTWVAGIEKKEVFGLWIMGGPRSGTTYAGYAALTELGRLPGYAKQIAAVIAVRDLYEDLCKVWDASSFARHEGSAAAWADRDQIENEVNDTWELAPAILLNDWSDSVPVEFFMRHIYPMIRRRISQRKPLVIAARFDPIITGIEERYFREEFVVTEVTHRGTR
jgi:hypothetical protein